MGVVILIKIFGLKKAKRPPQRLGGAVLAAVEGILWMMILVLPITGALSLAAVGGLMNYFVMVPLYAELYMPMETIIGMASAIFPTIDTLWKMILLCVVPFNLIKGALCGMITFLLYKKLAVLLKK
jgi:riboflavin transporter FmnP